MEYISEAVLVLLYGCDCLQLLADTTAAWNGSTNVYPPTTNETNGVGPVRNPSTSTSKSHHHPYHRK
ncbi:hypothetical protein V9T40_011201 [Parthenolecanium corni]|uniref:Uncharacterized protein n=1 Tax=Parthenolecanium corni TaxID=536013 RepID=A0AAN9T7G6_9HEMI